MKKIKTQVVKVTVERDNEFSYYVVVSDNKNSCVLTERQFEFRRDSQMQLIQKFYNADYLTCENIILEEIIQKHLNAMISRKRLNQRFNSNSKKILRRKYKLNQKIVIYESFLDKLLESNSVA